MYEQTVTLTARVVDAGQRFEPGMRVDFFPAEHDPRKSVLELAALGSYEVVGSAHVEVDDRVCLDIRLQRLIYVEQAVPGGPQHSLSGS